MRYVELAAVFIAIAAFIPALILFVLSSFHFFKMLGHFKSARARSVSDLIPLSVLWMADLYTEQGNHHRLSFLKYLASFVACVALIAGIYGALASSSLRCRPSMAQDCMENIPASEPNP